MKKNIITYILLPALLLLSVPTLMAQEEEPDMSPVRAPFNSGYLIDKQTMNIPYEKTLEFVIHHRFGTLDNGISDFFGLYAPSNIRMGLNYSIRSDVMIGIGATKNKKYTDLQWKWNIIEQTRGGTIPLTVTYFGNMAIDGRSEDVLGEEFSLSNRASFFSELILTRKFSYFFSMQASAHFSHFNKVQHGIEHDKAGIGLGARYRVSPQSSIIATADLPLHIEGMQEYIPLNNKPEPNFGIGWEISTATHVFQVFAGNGYGILNQDNVMFNQNDPTDGGWLLGFNITRLWSF